MNAPTPIPRDDSAEQPAGSLDAASLDRLRELDPTGATGIVARVLGAFQTSLQRLGAQFASACEVADHETMRQVAHTLRSSSASVGALELSAACRALETAVREGRLQDVPAAAAEVQRQFPRAEAAVRSELGSGART